MITFETFERAILFAVKKHRGQKRKGDGRPYILHPMAVMQTIFEVKDSKNMFLLGAVAILHDTVEDCGVTIKQIAKKFGYKVAALVEELTLLKENYDTIGKTKYLCQEVLKMSNYALCIKLADRLNNVRDMKNMSPDFIKRYKAETWEILKALKTRKLTGTQKLLIGLIKKEIQ